MPLREGDVGEVSSCRTCVGGTLPHHMIKWEETSVVDQARTLKELLL